MNFRRIRTITIGLTAAAVLASPFALPTPSTAQSATPTWLAGLNAYRANVGLPAVTEAPEWTQSLTEHVNYMMATGTISHGQDPNGPGATAAGAAAAAAAVLTAWTGAQTRSQTDLINEWVKAPFHSVHFFEPRWQRTAYAELRSPGRQPFEGTAALDVIRGVGPRVRPARPITFPGDGTTVPVGDFTSEVPNPLTSCPGYSAPSGVPLMVLYPDPVSGATADLKGDGTTLETCVIDANYSNPDPTGQATGRALLKQKNAIVVMPRLPLRSGVAYTVTVTSSAAPVTWSFKVDPSAGPTAGAPIALASSATPTRAPATPAPTTKKPATLRTTKKTTNKTTKKR